MEARVGSRRKESWYDDEDHIHIYFTGAQLGNFEMVGRGYICIREDGKIHGLSLSVKYVESLFRKMA